MADMVYRRLENNGEYRFGRGLSDFLERREAVGQAIKTRLLLFKGEWWEQVEEGLPFFQNIAGVRDNKEENIPKVSLLIQNIVANTRDVTAVERTNLDFDSKSRTLSVSYVVDTVYGEVLIDVNMATGTGLMNIEVR